MKKLSIMASLLMGALMFTACESDRDDNPVLVEPTETSTFQLNVPANATNNTYDLLNSEYVVVTASQPNYGGMPMAMTYTLQLSLDGEYTEQTDDKAASYMDLPTTYASPVFQIPSSELNSCAIQLYGAINGTEDADFPSGVRALYLRVKAQLKGSAAGGTTYSNVIELPKVEVVYQKPDIALPTEMYLCGGNIGKDEAAGVDGWKLWQKMGTVKDVAGVFYTHIYAPAGGTEFKWGMKEEDWHGISEVKTVVDLCESGVTAGDGDNVKIPNAGWYTITFNNKIVGNAIERTMLVSKAGVHVTGDAAGGWAPDVKEDLTAPADNTGYWTFTYSGSGEMRAYCDVPADDTGALRDWWRCEFTLVNGEDIFYGNPASNWADDFGAEYSNNVTPGQTLNVSFEKGKGFIK